MKLTPSQETAVAHRGSNLLVAASAGAGKTEVLARRCVSLIADPQRPCGIDRLLVVTFTRAAAAELRVRIARMLRDEADRSRVGDLRRHLRRQEMLVEAADIGTIDAWCGRIVREHFAEAGVDVRFSVLAEQDAQVLRAKVLDDLLDQIHRGGDALIDEARAWLARGITPDDRFLRDLITRLNAFREHLINPDQWFERQRELCTTLDAERVLAAALAEECGFQHAQLQRWLETLPSAAAVLQPYGEALGGWRARLGSPGTIAEVAAEIAEFNLPKPNRRKKEPPEPPEVTEVRQRWFVQRLQKHWSPDDVKAILAHEPATGALVATLLRLEERYQQMLSAAKWSQATYEFADVLRLTLDLLGSPAAGREREPTDIAHRLQQRYEHILVDEYQDTSPVQVEILRLVTRAGAGRTNRFMVGDVKQSIYGFRQAEPRLFAELSAAFEAGRAEGRVEYLADNFRSHARVLDALNQLFERLFDPALGGTPCGEKERLRAGRATSEIDNPTLPNARVEIRVIEHDPRRKQPESEEADEVETEVSEREAQLAAEQIRAMLDAGVQVPERGPDGSVCLRPLRLGDIVILLRSAVRKAGQVAGVLRRNGVHCVTAGRESLLDAVEVIDVCNVLKLLVNRRQDVPLAGYLRSPLAGLDETELLQVRTSLDDRNADFYAAVDHFRRTRPVASLAAKLDAALAQLDRWALAAQEEDLPALLRRIFQESGILLLARAMKGGEQRAALLRSLQSFATAFAGAGQGALDEFMDYLEALAAEEIDPGALAAGDEDAVRIMTIHGAKGLEFPVVFLLGAGTRFNVRRQQEPLQCDEELGLGLKFSDYPARATLVSARQHVNQRRVARREIEEELRLLYVATTRARERLIIVGHAKPGTWDDYRAQYGGRPEAPPLVSRMSVHSHLEWALMAAAGGTLLPVTTHSATEIHVPEPGAATEISSTPPPASTPEDEAWLSRAGELLAADVGSATADLPAMLSVSAVKELALRERAEDRPHVLDAVSVVLPTPDFAVASSAPDGRALGTACHRFLEHANLGRLASVADVQAQLDTCVAAGRLSPEQTALVPVPDLAWLATTELGALLARFAAVARREVPFVYALSLAGSGERTIVRGVIDCLLDTPAGLILVDYKTDHIRDERDLEERLAGYRVQLQLYALAASAIFERPVVRAALAFLRARRIVNVPLDVPALATLFDLPSVT